MKSRFPALTAAQSARVRAAQPLWSKLTRLVFQRHPHREWATYFTFGYRRTSWGVAVTLVDLVPPAPGDLSRSSHIVSFSPEYISRAVEMRDATPLGIGFVHSHPLGWGVAPSASDDDMDVYFARLSLPFGRGQPYLSLIVNFDKDGRLVFSGRLFDRGEWLAVTHLHVAGTDLERFTSSLIASGAPSDIENPILARWNALLGQDITIRFRDATVGFIGCSGTGSPAVETFARAQVGNFVLVDEQRFSGSNLERVHGSSIADVTEPGPFKVEIMARMIRSINPCAKVTALVGNGLDDPVIDELLRCDLVIGGTDTLHGRSLLGDLASLYLVPSIDTGVLPRGKNGCVTSQLIEIARYGVGEPCPYCQDRIPALALHAEMLPSEERKRCEIAAADAIKRGDDGAAYWQGGPPQLPAVGYLTTIAGAMAAGYGLNWILGTAKMPHQRLQFDLGQPEFSLVCSDVIQRQGCGCIRWQGHSDQGERSVSMPTHFLKAQRITAF